MLSKGQAKKVTIYVNESSRYHFGALYDAILEFLLHKGVSGATATRAIAGFGANRIIHTGKIEVLAQDLPVRIEFVESAEKIEELLPVLGEMVSDGLIEIHDTTVLKAIRKGKAEPTPPHAIMRGKAKLMRVYLGEADQWEGQPLYEAIIKQLRTIEISGATVHKGILGYGAKGHTHKKSFWHPVRDLPIMITVVDTEEKLKEAIRMVESMLKDGLIVLSDVEAIRLTRSAPTSEVPNADLHTR